MIEKSTSFIGGAFFVKNRRKSMGLRELFGLRGARDKPTNSYNSGVSFLFGRSTSGISVNERTAMQTTAVYSCVRILAEAIASLWC